MVICGFCYLCVAATIPSRRECRSGKQCIAAMAGRGGKMGERVDDNQRDAVATRHPGTATSVASPELLHRLGRTLHRPVTDIVGMVHIMRAGLTSGRTDVAEQLRELDSISADAALLLSTIERVVALADVEIGGAAPRERFDCRTTIADVVANARGLADKRGRWLAMDIPDQPIMVDGVQDDLRQILTEVLDNAIKYSEGTEVRIHAPHVGDQRHAIEVSDNGPGMPAEEVAQIFAPYQRGDAATRHAILGGGLGLALAQRLAARSGLTLVIKSAPTEGTTVTVQLD
jgi:signal transduction histidine kinase